MILESRESRELDLTDYARSDAAKPNLVDLAERGASRLTKSRVHQINVGTRFLRPPPQWFPLIQRKPFPHGGRRWALRAMSLHVYPPAVRKDLVRFSDRVSKCRLLFSASDLTATSN